MSSRELSLDEITALIKPQAKPRLTPEPPQVEQVGPARWFDKEMRCTRKRCNSATYLKVNGIPECLKHAIETLNNLCEQQIGDIGDWLQDAG